MGVGKILRIRRVKFSSTEYRKWLVVMIQKPPSLAPRAVCFKWNMPWKQLDTQVLVLGFSPDGILLAAERRNTNKLLDEVFHSEKIYQLNENMACSVAGITSDANVLTNELRLFGQRYHYRFREPMPCEQVVSMLCDLKQAYTQYGGKRPFGVSILYMGWDKHHGFQLYHSDPSGNYSGWKATCIGNNSSAAVSILKQEYKEGEMTLENVKDLSMKVLSKTLDMTKLTSDKIELATLRRVDGKTKIHILTAEEMDPLIAKFEAAEKEADEAKKAAEAKSS